MMYTEDLAIGTENKHEVHEALEEWKETPSTSTEDVYVASSASSVSLCVDITSIYLRRCFSASAVSEVPKMECTMERLNVDKGLLPFKGTYFCMLAGTASLIPYIEVYMKMLGLTLTETAIICGTIPLIHGVTRTIIGGLADKMNAHKSVFMLLCLVTAISYGCMVFVPQRTTPEAGHRTVHVELHCWTNGAHFFVCNGGSSTVDADIEGESHGSVAARYISFNASVCRWTCSVEEQHRNADHTETMLFIRPNQTDCLTVNQTATFEIGLGKLQRTTAENCRALTSPITDNGVCSCYTLQSFVVHGDTCEGNAVCETDQIDL
ncbi:hypothetical protein LSAT2_011724 [Lamellibrachia satsuma]|nr:hypothetical protein LSAT2_011724 [Lamellibrachia satsuma]